MIEKQINIIWIGDQSKRPNDCIQSWIDKNRQYKVRVWSDTDLQNEIWETKSCIDKWYKKEINGAADIMRWEILYKYGGIAVDADSICVNPLEDWLLKAEAFSCWENEIERPGLIACGFMGCQKKNIFVKQIIESIINDSTITSGAAWEKVGPLLLTKMHKLKKYANLTIYPSHFFIPKHYTGIEYTGEGIIFAKQAWGSTNKNYGDLKF